MSGSDDFSARQLLGVLRRRGWVVVQAVAILAAAGVLLALRGATEYEASAVLLVGEARAPLAGLLDSGQRLSPGTAARLVRTRHVAERVRDALGADLTTDELLARVSTSADAGNGFTFVTARGAGGAEAAVVANAFAREFVAVRAETPYVGLREAVQAIQRQLETVRGGPERDALRAQLAQLQTLAAVPVSDVELVDPAVPPTSPVGPSPIRDGLLGAALGLLFGLVIVLLLEALDPRVKAFDELRRLVPATQLAGVPAAVFRRPPRVRRRLRREPRVAAAARSHPESFERLRTTLLVFNAERDLKTILVTSPHDEREGKTTVASNLGVSLAKVGLKVCVVDADLRRPRLARHFGLESSPGLSDVLEGASFRSVVQWFPVPGAAGLPPGNGNGDRPDAPPEIAVLAAGAPIANPSEHLAGKAMQGLLDELEREYDIVIVDSAPMLAESDALPLVPRASGTLLVVRLFHTPRKSVVRAADVVARARGGMIGVVGTGVPARELREEGYGPWPVADPQPSRVA